MNVYRVVWFNFSDVSKVSFYWDRKNPVHHFNVNYGLYTANKAAQCFSIKYGLYRTAKANHDFSVKYSLCTTSQAMALLLNMVFIQLPSQPMTSVLNVQHVFKSRKDSFSCQIYHWVYGAIPALLEQNFSPVG